jgi:hypothetical protein
MPCIINIPYFFMELSATFRPFHPSGADYDLIVIYEKRRSKTDAKRCLLAQRSAVKQRD